MLPSFHSPQLGVVDFLVNPAGCQQITVRPLRGNLAIVEHQDLIRLQHGADALGNHKAGGLLRTGFQGCLNPALGFHVHRAGAVVQNEHARVDQ